MFKIPLPSLLEVFNLLYLVATPIGHLKDITLRAIETLQACDYILCEDTRHSLILLKHYEIHKPLISFHKFNEAYKEEQVIQDLKNNKTICLISDAGTPGISDPGARLVKRCLQENLKVFSVPGACAAISAICISGLETNHFLFYGFLPRPQGALINALSEILNQPFTSICYESPERIQKVLEAIHRLDAHREVVIARELTKKFEEVVRGTAQQLIARHLEKKFKGEIVLLIAKNSGPSYEEWADLPIEEHVFRLQQENAISLQEAIKQVATLRSIPKRQVYNKIHHPKKL
ncbi:Ribosomal RNA small subunit methyltransferase I [Neochlamydia sp. EPS4]|nr:Ribosomal RNA small subunit methyltransferase I [Neochlamydia sp. EPS4]